MAERDRKVKWLRSGGNPAWEKRSRSAVAPASSRPPKPGRGPCQAAPAPSPPALRPLVYPGECGGPTGCPGLTWPGMEKAEPQRFGEGGR